MGKSISLIGNPGVGKTTFYLALLHQLDKIGWAPQNMKTLPENYGDWIEAMISGERINPTLRLHEYALNLRDFQYKNSLVKTGWFGQLNIRIRDIKGDDYKRNTEIFKESVRGVSAILVMIDPTRNRDLGSALSGQVSPLVNSLRYISENERGVKYIGLIFTKRGMHEHPIKKIRGFIEDQLGAAINAARRSGLRIRMLEVESRGLYNRLEPWGIEEVVYDFASHLCKVDGPRYDVLADPDYDWIKYERTGRRRRNQIGN